MTALSAPEGLRSETGGSEVHVRWLMPEDFYEYPLDEDVVEDADEVGERLVELAEKVLPGADFEFQLEWAVMCAEHWGELVATGARYAGFCLAELDGARCTATVTASLLDVQVPPGERPVAFLASALRDLGLGEVSLISLPCGPAACCIGTRRQSVSADLARTETDQVLWTSFIQVQVPLHNGTALVMEMSTPSPHAWEVFSTMFAGIVRGIRLFDAEGAPVVMPG